MTNDIKVQTLLASLFAAQMSLDPYGEFFDVDDILDRGLEYDETSEDCKFYMNIEFIKLLNEGYTEDEILDMIDEMSVEGFNKLSDLQKQYVKDESKKLLRERKERKYYE